MKRRKFLVGAASAATATAALAAIKPLEGLVATTDVVSTVKAPNRLIPQFPQKEGYDYRWVRTDRISGFLGKSWELVTEYDTEMQSHRPYNAKYPHVGGLHLMRKQKHWTNIA